MKQFYPSISVFLAAAMLLSHIELKAASPSAPVNLKIQDNAEQNGVDISNPRFAWKIMDTDRGERQSGFRIIVSSSKSGIDANAGNMWDPGFVASAQQFGVLYNGASLESSTKYWWKVMTRDKDNNSSAWSDPAEFITGKMGTGDWSAQWIGPAGNSVNVPCMLRKEFSVSKEIDYAIMHICGIGQFELHINGEKIGDHELDPGWTDYTKTQQYVTFDISENLRSGSNAIGVWLADGFMDLNDEGGRYNYFTHSDGAKRMIAEAVIHFVDGSVEIVITDAGWKTSTGLITYSNTFGGEDHDGRADKSGWTSPGYNDAGWAAAVLKGPPGGVLVAQSQAAVKVIETLTPASMEQNGSSVKVNFGKTFAGIFELTVSGNAGQVIRIFPSEDNGEEYGAFCTYTLKGNGPENFRPKFWYFGQKYITIENASVTSGGALPDISSVHGLVLANAAKPVLAFSSSSDMLNKVLAINRQGILSNMYSFVTDCPHREKSPWVNDFNFTSPSFVSLFDMHALLGKISRDIADAQYANGMVPSLSPQYQVWDGGFLDSPMYGIAAMRFPLLMYQHYGDTIMLLKQYDVAKDALANITSHASGHIVGYGLGDWLSPDPVSTEFIETCIYYDFARSMQNWAEAIGNTSDASSFADLADNIKNAFNASFWNSATHSYGSQQTANAVPLHHGMQPDGEQENVLNALVASIESNDYHIACGQNSHGYMLQALSRYDRDDLVARIHTNTTGPGFGYWVTQGKTNTPEGWDGGGSQQHHMNNVIPEWVTGSLAGISPARPGYGQVTIKPTCATEYVPDAVCCSLQTIRGVIVSDWARAGSEYRLKATIPPNCSAEVFIPTFGQAGVSVKEGGTVIWSNGSAGNAVEGISFNRLANDYPSWNNFVVFNVGSGTYEFVAGTGLTAVVPVPAGRVPRYKVELFTANGRRVSSFSVSRDQYAAAMRALPKPACGVYIMRAQLLDKPGELNQAHSRLLGLLPRH